MGIVDKMIRELCTWRMGVDAEVKSRVLCSFGVKGLQLFELKIP